MTASAKFEPPYWARLTLQLAGIYNLAWGTLVILRPALLFHWAGMAQPNYPELWQCLGMVVGVYGIGYWIAAGNLFRHWPIVLVGLLGKVLGPIGFVNAALHGTLPWAAGWLNVSNDLVWWLPFAAILLWVRRMNEHWELVPRLRTTLSLDDELAGARDQHGVSVAELSDAAPLLIVLLRHGGCTFCREALDDLARQRAAIEAGGARIMLVHLEADAHGAAMFARYGLADVSRVSDPQGRLYAALELRRGNLWQVLGPGVIWRGLRTAS